MNAYLPPDFFTDEEVAYLRRALSSGGGGGLYTSIARKLLSLLPEPMPEPGDAVQFREGRREVWWPDAGFPTLRYEYVGRLEDQNLNVLRRFDNSKESLITIPGSSPLRKDQRS